MIFSLDYICGFFYYISYCMTQKDASIAPDLMLWMDLILLLVQKYNVSLEKIR